MLQNNDSSIALLIVSVTLMVMHITFNHKKITRGIFENIYLDMIKSYIILI